MKLWKKNYDLNAEIEKFTVGNDFILDHKLVKYDCMASIAHAKMLFKIGVLSEGEKDNLIVALKKIIELDNEDKFEIKQEDEDCHTAIENYLVKEVGDVGKKIHTARSRNDQVLTALRLYEKDELKKIVELIGNLNEELLNNIEEFGDIGMPGYTHMQKAMPTTVKVWLESFVSSLEDDISLIENVMELIDQSPLGSAAGFGVPVFDVDNDFIANKLGFEKVQENPMYCQMSRGKFESSILNSLVQVMFSLNKLCSDIILFNMKEFGFVELPDEFCTGSSIMPNKKNPDVLELIRANYYVVLGEEFKIKSMIGNLISGYNRDMQLTKEPLMKSIDILNNCLEIMILVFKGLGINEDPCSNALTEELYATEEAYKLVKGGVSFRDAYKQIGNKFLKCQKR
jgi:argininosuccinate lyase